MKKTITTEERFVSGDGNTSVSVWRRDGGPPSVTWQPPIIVTAPSDSLWRAREFHALLGVALAAADGKAAEAMESPKDPPAGLLTTRDVDAAAKYARERASPPTEVVGKLCLDEARDAFLAGVKYARGK